MSFDLLPIGSGRGDAPIIANQEVTLREPGPADTAAMAELAKSPWTSWWRTDTTPPNQLLWVVEHADQVVGIITWAPIPVVADLRFAVHPDVTDLGPMRRAVSMVLDHAFAVPTTRSVRWTAMAGDLAGTRVAHAAGIRLHQQLPDHLADGDGNLHDAWLGSIRADEDREPKTTWRWTHLDTERFTLRPLAETDDPRIRETLDDPISRTFLFDRPRPLTLAHAATERIGKWWNAARGLSCTWAVADAADDYLGDISLLKIDATTGAELGFYTHPDARGTGVLAETVPAVVDHAFDTLDLRRLTLFAAESNVGSQKLAEKAGFHRFGTQPSAALSGEVMEDLIGYELLRD